MKNFKSTNCELEFNMEGLKMKDLRKENSKTITVKSKSDLFRKLYDAGMEVSEIARECGSHYSFVYGVISSSREMRSVEKDSKSDLFRELAAAGKTAGEIAKETNSNYSFVFSVVKKYKESLEKETETEEKVAQ